MSDRGIYAQVVSVGGPPVVEDCLLIGNGVPRVHHGDGLPVYYLVEHESGGLSLRNHGHVIRVLVYPSAWPGPGALNPARCLLADHENAAWDGVLAIPVFDIEHFNGAESLE